MADNEVPSNNLQDLLSLLGGSAATIIPGLKLYHGSPKTDLTYLNTSTRGPLGPGLYTSDLEHNVARRYAGPEGRTYELPDQDRDIYWGHGIRGDDQYFGAKNDRERLINAADPHRQDRVRDIVSKSFPGQEGYPEFWDLSKYYGGQSAAQDLFKKAGFHGLSGNVDGPEVLLFKGQHLPGEVTPEQFHELGQLQRDAPERAMLRVQKAMGGGVLSPVVEHAGDLVHRMSDNAPYGYYGSNEVDRKVNNVLNILTYPYGFEREMNQNIKNNALFSNQSPDEFRNNLLTSLRKFGEEHAKLPSYNEAQGTANNINTNIGYQNWDEAIRGLNTLKQHLTTPEEWDDYASQGLKK